MRIDAIDHIYAEATRWDESTACWESLGFGFIRRRGSEGHRAGTLRSVSAQVVLAEIARGEPQFSVFCRTEDLASLPSQESVVTPPEPTHWGTRWARLVDAEGRVHTLEETS